MSTSAGRRGAALVAVVLITLGLFALGHGLITLSLGELAASRAGVRQLAARAAAEGALRRVMASSPGPWMDSLPVGEDRHVGGWAWGSASGDVMVRRLSTEGWWLEGAGRAGVAAARSGRLAWALDALERVKALPGAVVTRSDAQLDLSGSLDAADPAAVRPPLTSADCAPWLAALEIHYLANSFAAVATLPVGDTLPTLGLLEFSDLLSGADTLLVGGVGTPAPEEVSGACEVTRPWNWGDPDVRWRSCGGYLPLVRVGGDLRVVGGVGQVMLVVDGDLTLSAGARVHGLVLTRGVLRLEGGAALEGLALAAGGVSVDPSSRIRSSACWAVRALAAQRSVLGAFTPAPGTGTIGPL